MNSEHTDRLILFFCGLLSAAAFAPFSVWPVLFLIVPFLLKKIDTAVQAKQAFGMGWWFGWGHFISGLYWVSFSLGVEPEKFAWILPFSFLGLPAALALFTGCVTCLTWLCSTPGISRWFFFPVFWVLLEWIRGHIFTGFPWNLIGYALIEETVALQAAALVGPYGFGLLVLLAVNLPYFLWHRQKNWSVLVVLGGVLGVLFAWGEERLQGEEFSVVPAVCLRLIQPNISQKEKWRSEKQAQHLSVLLDLSRRPATRPITHLIFPEAAFPFHLSGRGMQDMPAFLEKKAVILTGAPRLQRHPDGRINIWNSLWILNPDGTPNQIYDKHHLVPFGEYIPGRAFLNFLFPYSFLKKITAGDVDFSAGKGPQTLQVPGAPPVSPLVCYEAIFPEAAVSSQQRPGWLLNITNDGWFGDTSGPYQHLAAARFRAAEQGLPLIRVANTGISAVIDGYGRLLHHLPLNQAGFLDFSLPVALPPTPYSRFGDGLAVLLGFFLMMIGQFLKRRERAR